MKKAFSRPIVIIVIVLLLSAVLVTSVGADRDPFRGSWTATDIDGSSMFMNIGGGGGMYRLFLYDDGGTVCNAADPFEFAASARGMGSASGANSISGSWDVVVCYYSPAEVVLEDVPFSFTYLPGADQLTEPSGVVWSRR
ncbi:MAG: hypothetical protein OEV06_09275 [Anaerolineae bacterium]|nr:hypothetical protein [Anaerolineae bacterium]